MYEKQIRVKHDDKVNPYTMRVDRQFIFLNNKYGKFNFLKLQDVKKMTANEVLDYLLDVLSYEQFLEYIGKYKRAQIVKKIESKILAIAKEKHEIIKI